MSLRVVGAGLGRTGTLSLKVALEKLLGAPCYHMMEVFVHPEHAPAWLSAGRGQMPDWDELFKGYAAAVDWPACAWWPEISAKYPDALVLLSTRDSSETWWNSANETIFPSSSKAPAGVFRDMLSAMFSSRFTANIHDRAAAIAAYERHNAEVRRRVPKHRLLEYQPGDGWAPLCRALGVPVPSEPYPKVNTREEFAARVATGPANPAS
ncbi:MAG: sulfotransferase family protein [Myxococcota bacterium]